MTDAADAPLDLAAVAAAHPIRRVTLDFRRLDIGSLLSVGDVVDMAAALKVRPEKLVGVLNRSQDAPLDVVVVIAWILGRKAEPDLELETVRRTWRIEVPDGPTVDPTSAARSPKRRSSARRTSSGSPA